MIEHVKALPTLDGLRDYVLHTLCDRDHLDPDQVQIRQAQVNRKGKPCGLFFQVQGPRLLRTQAIWVGDENRILFYDSTGSRFAVTSLSDSPDPARLGELILADAPPAAQAA